MHSVESSLFSDQSLDSESTPLRLLQVQVRTPYRSPELTEWGTILDLTRGAIFGGQDDGFTGTSGV